MKKSLIIAFSGVITALSVVLLYVGGIIWVLSYIMPLLSGVLMISVTNSVGNKMAYTVFVSTSILSLVLLPDKECALLYAMFFGYYPIIKVRIELLKNRILQILLKYMIFNLTIIGAELICTFVFMIPFDDVFGRWGIVILLVLANVLFVLYDKLLQFASIIYEKRIKNQLNKLIK